MNFYQYPLVFRHLALKDIPKMFNLNHYWFVVLLKKFDNQIIFEENFLFVIHNIHLRYEVILNHKQIRLVESSIKIDRHYIFKNMVNFKFI
jgi:hypothetical protein